MTDITQPSKRPLSPHLQVYKLPMTALMSISHRASGVILALGTILVTAVLIAAATGEAEYNFVMGLFASLPGKVVLFGWSLALYYHMCNGIRHLFWDMGYLFKLANAKASGFVVLITAAALTAGTWYCAYNF